MARPEEMRWRRLKSLLKPVSRASLPVGGRGFAAYWVLTEWRESGHRHMVAADHWASEYERVKAIIEATPEWEAANEDVRRKLIAQNFDLMDAAGKHKWAAGEAARLYGAITAELALQQYIDRIDEKRKS